MITLAIVLGLLWLTMTGLCLYFWLACLQAQESLKWEHIKLETCKNRNHELRHENGYLRDIIHTLQPLHPQPQEAPPTKEVPS